MRFCRSHRTIQLKSNSKAKSTSFAATFLDRDKDRGHGTGISEIFLCDKLRFESWVEQPCVARVPEATLLIHVDDVLYCGSAEFFHKKFLPCCQEQFTLSWSTLGEAISSITFLKKKFVATSTGIMVVPGTDVKNIVETFEAHFGKVKSQTIPCDSSIQLEDVSQPLSQVDAGWCSVVGSCLYLGRDRPDLVFTIKELASRMAKPTLNALQHLRKMVGNQSTCSSCRPRQMEVVC